MSRLPERRAFGVWLTLAIVVASVAMATPWAAPLRQSMRPQLPVLVVILATLSGVGQLAIGAVEGVGKRGGWNAAALPTALGISALLMALSFLPGAPGTVPRLLPIVGAACFAIGAAVLQRRARKRPEL
ncbi:MAG: hypothetical protein JJD97_09320 [Gemmatimonadaceae bacterium]|nr:hypothetical protein [Gemmatimonadaceae bacterium]